jgi:Tfp pilus assembly protein FimT
MTTDRRISCPRNARQRGYAFLDVLITVLILGILAAAAAPRFFDAIQRLRVDSAAKRVALDLKYARRQAKMRNAQETVSFDVANHRYALSTATDLNRRSQVYTVTLTDYPYETSLASVDFGGAASVTFNAYGAPDRAGQIVVRSGAYQKIVAVAAGSGDVTVQ